MICAATDVLLERNGNVRMAQTTVHNCLIHAGAFTGRQGGGRQSTAYTGGRAEP